MTTSPAVGRSSPANRPSSVVLPEPDAPTMATAAPGSTSKLTFSKIDSGSSPLWTILVRPSARMSGCIVLGNFMVAGKLRVNGSADARGGTEAGFDVRNVEELYVTGVRSRGTLESFDPCLPNVTCCAYYVSPSGSV